MPNACHNGAMTTKDQSLKKNSLAKAPHALDEQIFILEKKRADLEFLCRELDPFLPISKTMKEKLKLFHLDHIDDPFHLTAQLITLMENTIEELERLKITPSIPLNKETSSTLKN